MKKCFILKFSVLGLLLLFAIDANCAETNDTTIVDYLTRISGNQVQIFQPEGMQERLKTSNNSTIDNSQVKNGKQHQIGYRIQVFADNNQRTAKNEAMSRKRQISSAFPEWDCYLSYKAPSWRLRVGDFKTRSEAVEVMKQIQKTFPSYSREMIVVADRINVVAL